MRALLVMVAGLFVVGCGAEASEEITSSDIRESELGLTLARVSEAEVVGSFATPAGAVTFSSARVTDGVVNVTFEREGRVFTSHVDWRSFENDLAVSGSGEVTADDRAIFQALTGALEEELGKATSVADNLVRQSILWGAHPEGKLLIEHVRVSEERSWTTLCNGTSSRNFAHDTGSHALQTEYLKYGPGETTNPCRARCGPSCISVGTSAWTVDCGEHDRCEQLHGSGCGDEFTSASDDFSFAGNCNY